MLCDYIVVGFVLDHIGRIYFRENCFCFLVLGVEVKEGGGIFSVGVASNHQIVALWLLHHTQVKTILKTKWSNI